MYRLEGHPLQKLQEIMLRHGTFIPRPDDDHVKLLIWGEKVEETKAELSQWERAVRESSSQTKPASWCKSGALDGRAENRNNRHHQKKQFDDLLRQASVDFPVESALLWPKDLDIEEFERDNADVLDELRSLWVCRISFYKSEESQHISVTAQSDEDAIGIMTRMVNLVKETISRRDQLLAVNLVHLPDFHIYRDRVGLLDQDPWTRCYLPTLHGNPGIEEEEWARNRRATHVSNRKKVKKTIDFSIKRLRLSQQHVRLRVVFGELGFTLFQKPSEGETYKFTDFYDMVTKGRTKLSLNSIPARLGNITDLPDVLNSMDAFSNCTESYGAFFDFPASRANTVLRLETVFDQVEENEFEVREQRWVEIGNSVSRLQVSLFNFDRPDYQVTLDAFPLHTNAAIKSHMAHFQSNISFERPPHGIKSLPRRRVKYPPGQRSLQAVAEITFMRWRYKKTDAFFELRRKDLYEENLDRTGGPIPVRTSWHGLYYYPEWDNLMSEFARISPGEEISWAKSASTFFPESDHQHGAALPKGFKTFISEVEEIQDLLAEAVRIVAQRSSGASKSNGAQRKS